MTKKELEEIRDKLIYEHFTNEDQRHFTYHYEVGFNACADLLLPIIKDYKEALAPWVKYEQESIDKYGPYENETIQNFVNKAREVLKKHRGN